MDSITNFLPMWKIKELKDKVTNVVMNYTEVEVKVREATNDEAWGPHGTLMQEIAQYTLTYEHYSEVMGMLWKRMFQENKENWRIAYKSLLLLTYLLKNGSEKCVTSAREHLYDLRSLETFAYVDENGKDQGINVRIKVKEIIELVQDDERIREERKKAKKNREKFSGYSTSSMGSFGTSSRSYNDFNSFSSKSHDLDDKDWRSNSPTFGEKISDLKSKVKDIIETSTNPDTESKKKTTDTIYSDSDEEAKKKSDPFSDLSKRSSIFSNLDPPSKTSAKTST
ncbi:clathrin interactor 1-like, partial [Brachionus plicatilis]